MKRIWDSFKLENANRQAQEEADGVEPDCEEQQDSDHQPEIHYSRGSKKKTTLETRGTRCKAARGDSENRSLTPPRKQWKPRSEQQDPQQTDGFQHYNEGFQQNHLGARVLVENPSRSRHTYDPNTNFGVPRFANWNSPRPPSKARYTNDLGERSRAQEGGSNHIPSELPPPPNTEVVVRLADNVRVRIVELNGEDQSAVLNIFKSKIQKVQKNEDQLSVLNDLTREEESAKCIPITPTMQTTPTKKETQATISL